MQEQQGNLEEPLSGLPGPRPFNKNNKKGVPMEDSNNKELNDIVARATEALSSGKAFGGWTDNVEEQRVKQGKPIPMTLGKGEKVGSRKDKSGTLPGLMTPQQKRTKVGVLSHVEHDGEFLDEKVITNSDGTKVKVLTPEQKKRHNLPRSKKDATTRPNFPRPRGTKWWKTDEEVATQPRQLKDKKKEMLVHDKKGKVKTIDKKDLEQYQKDNPGSGVAEGLGSMLGGAIGSVVPGVGTMVGAAVGGLAGKMFKKKKQPGEESKT